MSNIGDPDSHPAGTDPPGTLLTLDAAKEAPFEIWAFVLCLVAWPEKLGRPDFETRWRHLAVNMLRARADRDKQWRNSLVPIRPSYFLLDPRLTAVSLTGTEEQGTNQKPAYLRGTYRRLERALTAGQVLWPFLQEVIDERLPPMPAGIATPTLDAVTAHALGFGSAAMDAHNFEAEIFRRRTKPVLHLVAALEAVSTRHENEADLQARLERLAWHEGAVRGLILLAEHLEGEVARIQRFAVDPSRQVRLRVRGWEMPPGFVADDSSESGA